MGKLENDKGNKAENKVNTKDFLIGALIGGMAGAAVAVFLSPKSGKEMRSGIQVQAHVLKEKTGKLRDVAVLKGTEIAGVAKEKTTAIGQAVSKQSSEIMSKVKNLRQAVSNEEVEDAIEDLVEAVAEALEDIDIQQKLEETKKAFDETELQLNS